MRHFASPGFWRAYQRLPERVRALADKNFDLIKRDQRPPSLHFKPLGAYWSARIGAGHRALARPVQGGMLWFWIGSHADDDALIK